MVEVGLDFKKNLLEASKFRYTTNTENYQNGKKIKVIVVVALV